MSEDLPKKMLYPCEACNQEGYHFDKIEEVLCPSCKGEGYLEEVPCDLCDAEGCPRCYSRGYLTTVPCNVCRELGYLQKAPMCVYCNGTGRAFPETFYT